jgi:L-lactate dehydrogenase complex protein LldG
MNGNSREAILRNVRRGLYGAEHIDDGNTALDTDTVSEKAVQVWKRYTTSNNASLLEQLIKELYNVNSEVYKAGSEDELREYVIGLVRRKGIESFAVWESDCPGAPGLIGLLNGEGLTHIKSNDKNEMARAGIGITGADYAIADTGTLVLLTDGSKPRTVSLLPPVHLAIVKESNIVCNINELFIILKDKLDAGEPVPSCMTFITGPSRTADIELNLTLGVHGPKELHVIIT